VKLYKLACLELWCR